MSSLVNKKTNVQNQDSQPDFVWSFQPILIWMRVVLGVELDKSFHTKTGQFCWSWALVPFGFLILVVSSIVNLLSMVFVFDTTITTEDNTNRTNANMLITIITGVNDSVHNVAIHHVFYAFVLMNSKWKSLWVLLQKIQSQSPKLDQDFYLRCRRIALTGTVCNVVNLCFNLYMAATNYSSTRMLTSLMSCFSRVSETLSLSIVTVFCVLIWMTIHMYYHLNSKTAELQHKSSGSLELIGSQLENWRSHHALVCQLLDKINACFGIILLVATSHSFISFITDTFEITTVIMGSNKLQILFVIRFIQHFIMLALVCIGSSLLQIEASNSLKNLRQLSYIFVSPNLQSQLNGVILEVGRTQLNKITAADFFDVNLTLFPTLIGTTLTYLIILYQQV